MTYLREKIVLFSHLVQHLMCLYGRFQVSSQNLKDILIYLIKTLKLFFCAFLFVTQMSANGLVLKTFTEHIYYGPIL